MPSQWYGAAVEAAEGKPAPEEWHEVAVPGRPSRFAGADRVAYRATFADPRDPGDAVALLELRGLYAGGDVWLDGERVASPDAVFEPVRVPFVPEGETEVVVACRAPDDRFGGIHDTDRVPASDSVPGIWWGADVRSCPRAFVVDVDLTPHLTDGGDGVIDAALDVYASEAVDERVTLTTRPAGDAQGRGMMERVSVVTDGPGRTVVEPTIEVRDPSLWWPRGYGDQHRYEVRAKLDDTVATATTGFASVTKTPDGGLAVNDEPVPVRGVTLQDGAAGDVDLAREVNANLVRAHAHALSPAVYAACDEAGLLVWQDLPLTGPGSFDVERGRDLARGLVAARGAHPSLAAVGVHDHPTATFADRVDSGLLDRYRFRWRVWRTEYDRGPAEDVAAAVPDGVVTYPVVGEPGTDPDAAALYPGWDYGSVADVDRVRDRYGLGDVVAEFGAGALAAETDSGTDGGDNGAADTGQDGSIAGFDRAKHDAVVGDDDPAASQAYQAELVRGLVERFRRASAPVVVANALRDTDAAGMGVFAREGDPKEAAGELATAFEPLQVFLVGASPGEVDVVVVNDTPRARSGTLTWAAGNERDTVDVTVGSNGRATVDTIAVPSGAGSVEVELETPERAVTNTYYL